MGRVSWYVHDLEGTLDAMISDEGLVDMGTESASWYPRCWH